MQSSLNSNHRAAHNVCRGVRRGFVVFVVVHLIRNFSASRRTRSTHDEHHEGNVICIKMLSAQETYSLSNSLLQHRST